MTTTEIEATRLYQKCFDQLASRVKRMAVTDWSPTPERKAHDTLGDKIDALLDEIEDNLYWAGLEAAHQELYAPEGDEAASIFTCDVAALRRLGKSARAAAMALPDPRNKPALPVAALGLLWLRADAEFERASLYENGAEVVELERLCKASGIRATSRDNLRKALSKARADVDQRRRPSYIDWLLYGRV